MGNFLAYITLNLSYSSQKNMQKSQVGIATGYGLDGPGIESRWGRVFPHLSRPALAPTQPPVHWVLGLSQGKGRPGLAADNSPSSSAAVMEE